ncbi:MAG: DUF5685 family protein [Acutalibacteraceae bacterium]|nr:DUF5685 family protein [Acutalibacteraceae bacterium]
MFGYVKICKPQLKVCEYDAYKAIYCTLCKRIGKKYGLIARWTLNYDFAFLAMLNLSVLDKKCSFEKKRCTTNPFKKCNYCCGCDDIFDFASGVSVILLYYSLIDKIKDEKGLKKVFYQIFKLIINRKFKKATKELPNISDIVKEYSDRQFEVERNGADIDLSSEPTAIALGKIFETMVDSSDEKRILYRMGYCTGKWIYLADALDDLNDDIKKNRFNPLIDRKIEDVQGTLNVSSTDAGLSFELLNTKLYDTIIKNVYYLGMPNVIKSILLKRDDKK